MKPDTLKQHRSNRFVNPQARKDNGCINLPYRGFVTRLDGSVVKHSPRRQRTRIPLEKQLYRPSKYKATKRRQVIIHAIQSGLNTISLLAGVGIPRRTVQRDLAYLINIGRLSARGKTNKLTYCVR